MSDPRLEIHDTCACGAEMIARGEINAVHLRHREWLGAHEVCRLRFHGNDVPMTDPNKPAYDEPTLRTSDLPKRQW